MSDPHSINLQQHLGSPQNSPASQYSALPTERLMALADSKHLDLLQDYWDAQEGPKALDFLIDLAGLNPNPSMPFSLDSTPLNDIPDASGFKVCRLNSQQYTCLTIFTEDTPRPSTSVAHCGRPPSFESPQTP